MSLQPRLKVSAEMLHEVSLKMSPLSCLSELKPALFELERGKDAGLKSLYRKLQAVRQQPCPYVEKLNSFLKQLCHIKSCKT